MELQRIGIKVFADASAAVPLREFIPIFHGWIQKQSIPGHQLIDTHNYSHIHNGPGILLVAAEGNFSIDMADGRMGLLYWRKLPGDGIGSILETALLSSRLLEEEPSLAGRLWFRRDELQVIANDRLNAPNEDATFRALTPELTSALQLTLPGMKWNFARTSVNPKDRLTIQIRKT